MMDNRPQRFPTVRIRSCVDSMAVPVASFPKASKLVPDIVVAVLEVRSFNVHVRFVWQAQWICKVLHFHVAFFLAGTTLWSSPCAFCASGAALSTCVATGSAQGVPKLKKP